MANPKGKPSGGSFDRDLRQRPSFDFTSAEKAAGVAFDTQCRSELELAIGVFGLIKLQPIQLASGERALLRRVAADSRRCASSLRDYRDSFKRKELSIGLKALLRARGDYDSRENRVEEAFGFNLERIIDASFELEKAVTANSTLLRDEPRAIKLDRILEVIATLC